VRVNASERHLIETRDKETGYKISAGIETSGYDVIVAFSSWNFTYLTGAVLPFAPSYLDRRSLAVRTRTGDVYAI